MEHIKRKGKEKRDRCRGFGEGVPAGLGRRLRFEGKEKLQSQKCN